MVSARRHLRAGALALALLLAGLSAAEPAAPEAEAVPEVTASAGSWLGAAEKGQWARARVTLATGPGRTLTVQREQKVTQVTVDAQGRHVTVASTVASGGNDEKHEQRFLAPAGPHEAEPEPAAEKAAGETLTVAGAKLACEVTVRKLDPAGPAPHAVKTWTCAQVPLGGLVRVEHDGKPVFELLDFGPRK
ncbi:MAG: hypothetical protein KIS92_24595 [Planctomycetota bacterium]|nr:hypothetical protein [Planctomycetota bacterium]